jgi:hypothetical protein
VPEILAGPEEFKHLNVLSWHAAHKKLDEELYHQRPSRKLAKTLKAYFHVQAHLLLVSILSQMNPDHIFILYIFKINFSIMSRSQGLQSLQFLTQLMYISHHSYTWTWTWTWTWWVSYRPWFLQIIKFLILWLYPTSCCFSPTSKYLLKNWTAKDWDRMEGSITIAL